MVVRVLELLLVVWGWPQLAESHSAFLHTALLTTKAEAWPVRVATHAMSHSRHAHHTTTTVVTTGWVWMMLRVLEL